MHKVITFLFLETLYACISITFFIQLKIIKLSAIDSTNSYLKELSKNLTIDDGLVVVAQSQQKGRGQAGTHWQSKSGESLTFSVFKRYSSLDVQEQTRINFGVALGIKTALDAMAIPQVTIKWPNDIMSYSKKVAGVLVENQLQGSSVVSSIIGIGLNVNETTFDNLPQASSLRLATGISYDLDVVLKQVAGAVLSKLSKVTSEEKIDLQQQYEASLFKKDVLSDFQPIDGAPFSGYIRGVDANGQLLVAHENGPIKSYQLKQLKMRF